MPLALRLRASCPSQRSVPPPCRPGVAKQVRLGRRRSPGGSLRSSLGGPCVISSSTQRYPKPSGSHTYSCECWEAEFREVHTIPIDSRSLFSNSPPYWTLSGLGDCPNTISIFLSRAPKRCLHSRIYEHGGSLIHRVRGSGILRTVGVYGVLRSSDAGSCIAPVL